eukprot:s58_g22.t1
MTEAQDVAEVAAHALVRAEVEQASQMNFSPEKIGLLAWSAALSMLSFKDAKRVVQMEAPKMVSFPQHGALDEVLIQQGLNSSIHDLDASAENFVRSSGAPTPNRWVNQQTLCSGALKKSGILDALKQLQLEDEALLVAAAVAKASADFHLSPAAVAASAVSVGHDTRCAVDAICSSAALDLPTPHVAYLAARTAASAVSDRWEQFGMEPESVGHMALQAVRGAAPHMVPAVAADLAVAAAAEACAARGAAPAAAIGALTAQKRCPGTTAVPGAQAAAAAVARHCVVDMGWRPVTCGYEAHEAARAVLVACNMGMTHAAALADQALSGAYAQRAARLPAWKVSREYTGDSNARLVAGVSIWARTRSVIHHFALRVTEAQAAKGHSAQELGYLAKSVFSRSNGTGESTDPATTLRAAAMVIEAVVRRNVLQHNSPDLIAKEAQLAAHSAGCSDHMLLLRTAVSALTDQEAALGSSPSKIGEAAKNLALALAVAPPTGMNSSTKELISFRSAMYVAAQAAARSTILQQLTEQHGPPVFAREAVVQALVAARATGHPLGSQDMAELVGKTVVDISLKQGESSALPEILKMSVLALQPSAIDLRAAALAASLAVAKTKVAQGVHPARIRKEVHAVLEVLPADVIGPVKSHLASEATIEAVAQHVPADQLQHLGSLLREAAEWDPITKPRPGATASMAFGAALHVANRLAQLGMPERSVAMTRRVVESLGLPKAEARRISLRAVAQVEAQVGSRWPDGCRQAGEMARKVVMAGIAPEKMWQDDLESGHAFLSMALPAALKAAVKAGPEDPEQMAACARSAAQGAIGKDAKTALQGEWITEAADLVAAEAAKTAVMEGQLPFQVTAWAEKASASLRSSSPETHHSDGMAAAKAILHHGLEVSADLSETARLARVAAESSGLRIEEARHQVAEQLASMLANQQGWFPLQTCSIRGATARKHPCSGTSRRCSGWFYSSGQTDTGFWPCDLSRRGPRHRPWPRQDTASGLLDLFGPVTLGRLAAASCQLRDRVQWMVQRLKNHRDGLKEDLFFFCGRCAMKTIQRGVLRNGAWSTPQIPGRPTRNQGWLPSPELPTPRFAAAAAVLGKDILDVTEKFDPVENRWSRPPELQLSCARSECAAAVLDERVYLVAGTSWGKEIPLVERCDGRGWEEVEPLSLARSGCAAAVTGGHLYVVGGFARGDSLRLFERFDGSRWTQLRPTLTGRWSCAAVGLQGSIYLCGGYNGGVPLDSVDRYDPRFDALSLMRLLLGLSRNRGWWERVATLPTPRKHIAALAREDTLYIMGGFDGSRATSVSESRPGEVRTAAELMSLDPASSHAVAAAAKVGASDAGCGEAESAWIASHAAAEAVAKMATERGASTKVVATLALAAAQASGVPQNEAQRIAAWSASKATSNQALILGASVAETGETALAAAHFAGLTGGTASRLAAEAAAKAVLQQARDSSASHSRMAMKCKEAALAAGLEPAAASLLAASLVCPKAAEVAATMQQSPHQIGSVARAAAQAAGVEELQGAEEAGVAAASAAVQSALSAGGVHPSKVASLAQEAWRGAGASGTTVAPCIAATAILKRLASQRHSVPEDLAQAAEAISADAPAARKQVASILAKAVAESAARRGGREEEVAHTVLKSLRDAHTGLPEEKIKEMTAMAASTAVAKAAVQQGREPAVVSAMAAKAALASGMPNKDVKDVACVASAAAIAKHSKHVRHSSSQVADLVLQAAHAAGCEDQRPLVAAITAASRSAAKASLALHGTSAASMARAAWRAATEVLEHLGHGGIDEDKSLWAQIVSIEAVNDWQAQAFVAGLQAHAAEGKAKIEKAIAGVRAQAQEQKEQERWLMGIARSEALWVVIGGLCILGLTYWSGKRLVKAAGAAFSIVTGVSSENCESRAVQKFCCAPTDQEALYSALNQPQNDFQTLDDDEEPIRHNVAAHAGWFDGEDRFAAPAKLVVILERAMLERSRELVGTHAKAPRPDHELQFTFDALETLLDSQLNEAGRLIIYLHSAEEVIVEVHPGFCMPSSLQRFAKIMLSLLRRRRFTGSTPEAPAVLRGAAWYALSPQGESVHLKEFVREIAGSPGFGCLPPSSSSERVSSSARYANGSGASDEGHIVFSIGASAGDATKDPTFRGNSLQRLSICPWDLTGAACCRMLCSEFESLWNVHRC